MRNIPKQSNAELFAKWAINRGDEVFHFKDAGSRQLTGQEIKVNEKNIDLNGVTLDEMFRMHHTLSLLIIKNDSILYERYAGGSRWKIVLSGTWTIPVIRPLRRPFAV